MEQKAYWNSVSDSKSFTTPMQEDAFTPFISPDSRILDVGFG